MIGQIWDAIAAKLYQRRADIKEALPKLLLVTAMMHLTSTPSSAETVVTTIKDTVANMTFVLKLELPSGFKITRSEGPDFYLYEVEKGSKVYIAIYSGNHPDFPHEHIEGSETTYFETCIDDAKTERKVYGEPLEQMKILSEWKDGKLVHREMLIRYSLGAGWPAYLHAVTTRYLSQDELQVADRILFSLQLKPEMPKKDLSENQTNTH